MYDVIVIGSGFGGAVTACRLAEKGRRVLVLERGRRWAKADYPRQPGDAWIWDDEAPERDNGWIDLKVFKHMAVVQGAGVGGGSLIYANIVVEPPAHVFDQGWPPEITYAELQPRYHEAGRMMGVQELPDSQLTGRFRLMREAAAAAGHGERFRKLPLAVTFSKNWAYEHDDPHAESRSTRWTNSQGREQGTCIHCGNCDIGCPVHAKNTLDLNYLAAAENAGAEIRSLHLVTGIVPQGDGYRVEYDALADCRRHPGSETAHRVVVAAGSLGSTELLLHCRDRRKTLPKLSRRLGYGWCSNGDFLTPALYRKRAISPTRGPTITCAIDFLDGAIDGHRFFVEDGGFPDVLGNALERLAGRGGAWAAMLGQYRAAVARALRDRDPAAGIMPWFGQAVDYPDGRLRLGRPWWAPWQAPKLDLDWDVTRSRGPVQAMADMHRTLTEATDGLAIEPITWSLFRYLITPHPLGGCGMADSPASGVVDHKGEAFGHPGLFVADGAIVPRALGLNPSRTIAALAERIAALWDD